MNYELLPKPVNGKFLKVEHFPASYQTLIFRLWEMVSAEKIAEVIKTTKENVINSAYSMGLKEQKNIDQWLTRGYISIIKAVWQLLPYEQMLLLLDWDEARLDFCLKEDDFLGGKLGEKCDCPPVLYRELTQEEKEKTKKIKASMEKHIQILDEKDIAIPFDFWNSKYKPLISPVKQEIAVNSDWCIEYPKNNSAINDYVEDFEEFAKTFGITFKKSSDKKIILKCDIETDDEEYHEIDIKENEIIINAGHDFGVLRGIYFLEDLAESAGTFTFKKKSYKRKTKVKTRFLYSFCGLYADVLDKDTEISFPQELLKEYAKRGINGVWIQGVLYKLAPYPFDEKQCVGWEKRLENLDKLTKRAARYGIKVYMYINEPRCLPLAYFEKHPELKGSKLRPNGDNACLCTSHPDTHKYLKDALQTVCKRVPELGGFFNITQTENRVLCYSSGATLGPGAEPCPVCFEKAPSEVISGVIKTMADAICEINPKMKYFYFAWSLSQTLGQDEANKVIELLPKNVIVLQVSETQMPVNIPADGANDIVDYSIAIVGPGEVAKNQWRKAKECGLETAAKVQISNSWECSSAPFIPVYDNIIEHMQNLSDEGVEHIMLSWTLGGYISDNIKIASSYFFDDGEQKDAYDNILTQSYGSYKETVKEAVHHFSDGFKNFPFNWKHIYTGPCNEGVANLLYTKPSGMTATMTCFPYDDLQTWRGLVTDRPSALSGPLFKEEVLLNQYALICDEWEKGLEIIKDMPTSEFKDMAIYCYTLFKSSYNQIKFYMEREGKQDKTVMRNIVESEKELAISAYEIMLRNASVGYEAANHYYVTRSKLAEKVVQCDYILENYYK